MPNYYRLNNIQGRSHSCWVMPYARMAGKGHICHRMWAGGRTSIEPDEKGEVGTATVRRKTKAGRLVALLSFY
jgi:hypothetical protein